MLMLTVRQRGKKSLTERERDRDRDRERETDRQTDRDPTPIIRLPVERRHCA